MLEGFHALKHALRFGAVVEEVAAADPEALGRLAEALAPDVAGRLASLARPVPAELFARLAPVPPATGVIALARRPSPGPLSAVAGDAPVVLLDQPSRPGNVGAVVRVAAAAGASAVATTGPLDPWQPAALRGSAGLHFALPVLWLEQPLDATGRELVALDPGGDELAAPGAVPPGSVLAFGTERSGLTEEVRARASRRLAIPMRAGVSSLNLATAVAVVLYALPPARR